MRSTLAPHVTLIINGQVRDADCPLCRESLHVAYESHGVPDSKRKLEEAFDRHMRIRHPDFFAERGSEITFAAR